MQKRRLGKNGPELSILGIGTWSMGGPWRHGWGPVDDQESIRTIHQAFADGVNWIDTAPSYGLGHAEEITGQALQGRRDQVYIATKCGIVWNSKGRPRHDLNPGSIRQEVEASLRRLQTDYIDLYQIHWPDPAVVEEKPWRELESLQRHGKVRWLGVSNFDVDKLQSCETVHHIDSLQPPYHLLRRNIETEIIPFCQQHGIGIVAYSPLASGLLSGHFDIQKVAADDWRMQDEMFKGDRLQKNLHITERLKQIAAELNTTVAALAIAFVLRKPQVTSAIVGSRRVSQWNEAVAAAPLQCDEQTWHRIEQFTE
jgi:aryl-alcohol dehydrogenase-like predicted oxidoreductase